MDHGTFIGVTSWHFQCWLHQVFWLKSTAITPSIDSFWICFRMRVRVCSCLTHRITKHLIPLSIILKCLFLSPFAFLLIFLSPHIHLLPVVLYPSLYLSIITAMTHVAHTCSAVKGGLREGVAFHRLTDIKKPAQWTVWKGVTMYFSHTLTVFFNLHYGLGWKTGFRRQYSSYTRHDSDIQKHLPYNSRSWQVWLQQISASCCPRFWQDETCVLEILCLPRHRCEM